MSLKLFVTSSNIAHLVEDCPYLRPGTRYNVLEYATTPAFTAALHWTQTCKLCKDPVALGIKRMNWRRQQKFDFAGSKEVQNG